MVKTIILIVVSAGSVPAFGQIRLYDTKRDAAAQDAKKLADQIRSGELFRKETETLRLLTKQDAATVIADSREEMLSWINSFVSWSDLDALRAEVDVQTRREPPPDIAAEKRKLDELEANLKRGLAGVQAAAASATTAANAPKPGTPAQSSPAKSEDDIHSAVDAVKQRAGKDAAAVTTAVTVFTQLQSTYDTYTKQLKAINQVQDQLKELKTELKRALLVRLQVEESYLVTQVNLYERRERELEPVRRLLSVCRTPEGVPATEHLDETLQRLSNDPPRLDQASRALLACTSLAAEGNLPDRLFRLRLAELEHLRSVRVSAANAQVLEAFLGGGVDRLALYYQGGVKPETLAQIAQALATTGIFGKLLSQ
jgi:hypothetical protein